MRFVKDRPNGFVKIDELRIPKRSEGIDELPKKLIELLDRSDSLYRRIARLDDILFRMPESAAGVKTHMARLKAAFGQAAD